MQECGCDLRAENALSNDVVLMGHNSLAVGGGEQLPEGVPKRLRSTDHIPRNSYETLIWGPINVEIMDYH